MNPMSRQGSCLNPRFSTASSVLGLARMGMACMCLMPERQEARSSTAAQQVKCEQSERRALLQGSIQNQGPSHSAVEVRLQLPRLWQLPANHPSHPVRHSAQHGRGHYNSDAAALMSDILT
jgi:hypothetical protein